MPIAEPSRGQFARADGGTNRLYADWRAPTCGLADRAYELIRGVVRIRGRSFKVVHTDDVKQKKEDTSR